MNKKRIYHFVRMDYELGIHSFFYMDHIQMSLDIFSISWLFHSNNLVIDMLYINYLQDEVFKMGICIFQFQRYIKNLEGMIDICLHLNSNDKVNCMKYICLQIHMVHVEDTHIIIFPYQI